MKAIAIQSPRRMDRIDLPDPVIRPDDVLLRVQVVGFCGSDLNTYRGLNPLVTYPRVPGHEIGAVVESCGRDVPEMWQPGMTVTCSPYTSCGDCAACDKGRFNACKANRTLGVQRDGALTEFIVVHWRKLFHAAGLGAAACALVEPLAVGFHAAARAKVQPSETVVVIGTGVVGLGAICEAARRRAGRVIAVDVEDRKLALACKAGATGVINSAKADLHDMLASMTHGRGPDIVIEAVGSRDTFLAAVDEVSYAGRVVYVGYSNVPVTYDTKQFLLKELEIRGSRGSTPQDLENVIKMLQGGAYPIGETVTHTVGFEEVLSVIKDWDMEPARFTKIQVRMAPEDQGAPAPSRPV